MIEIELCVSDESCDLCVETPICDLCVESPIVIDSAPVPIYDGATEVTPKAHQEQVLPTSGKLVLNDVTVFEVPYYETSNLYDGLTAYIAAEV